MEWLKIYFLIALIGTIAAASHSPCKAPAGRRQRRRA